MISNTRIEELKVYLYNDFLVDNVEVDSGKFDDIYECLGLFLTARQTIEKLIEDGERLANAAIDEFYSSAANEAVKQHATLMKELGR